MNAGEPRITAQEFLAALEQVGLVSGAELETLRLEAAGDSSAETVARKLVEQRRLTHFQAEKVLEGRGAECVLAKRYRVLERLGAGGMGAVYRARDIKLDRDVAIKLLPAELVSDSDAVARFHREAKALAKLSHPAIIQAYDAEEDRGQQLLVLEYVPGATMQRVLHESGKVPPLLAADYLYQAAVGMAHAHHKGLVHRDLKPSNLLVTPDGRVKILDLGLARFLQDQIGDPSLTQEGMGMGTPNYMAPEQFVDARKADARADIYALGCTLYHLLTGAPPFPGTSLMEKRLAHETREPTPVETHCPEAPLGLAMIVRRMMAKRPSDRFQTAGELADALALYVAGSSASLPQVAATSSWRQVKADLAARKTTARRRLVQFLGVAGGVVLLGLLAFFMPRWWRTDVASTAERSGESTGEQSEEAAPERNGSSDSRPGAERGAASGGPSAEADGGEQAAKPPPIDDDPNVLTVAQDGSAEFKSIGDALKQVKPGMTIRVVDDAVYRENIALTRTSDFAGLVFESPNRATIESDSPMALLIHDVPGVRFSGFRLRPQGVAAVVLLGNVQGAVLRDLEIMGKGGLGGFTSQAANSMYGFAVEGASIADDRPPLVIENCSVRGFASGVRISAINNDYKTAQPGRRIIVRGNTIQDCFGGIVLVGQVQEVQVVGNRILAAPMMALQLEMLLEGARDVLIANNTVFDSKCAFRLWDQAARGENIRICNNLIVGRADSPDMVFIDNGGDLQNARGPGDGLSVHAAFQWGNNWREVRQPTGTDLIARSWIPPATTDVVRDDIPLLSRDSNSPDFLRPAADSELASGGVGGDLPKYVGALAPPGVEPWDWQAFSPGRPDEGQPEAPQDDGG